MVGTVKSRPRSEGGRRLKPLRKRLVCGLHRHFEEPENEVGGKGKKGKRELGLAKIQQGKSF